MPRSTRQKQKLLYIWKFLLENTDETHSVTTAEIISYLDQQDIKAERKSIYDDIATLEDFGLDIVRVDKPQSGYRLVSRDFELTEVKVLVDLVQSSKFITTKKSKELIKKLEHLVSKNDAKSLQRQVTVADRNKTANEMIYYTVDIIHEAIGTNRQIAFQYFDWDVDKSMHLRKGGALYQVSPWLLTWDDENYYLVAYSSKDEQIRHYRVDKMLKPSVVEEPRQGQKEYEKKDISTYAKKTFGMFAGEEQTIQLICKKHLTGVMVDRFGSEVAMRKEDEEHIRVRAKVEISPLFYGWLIGLGTAVKLVGPQQEVERYKAYLQENIKNVE